MNDLISRILSAIDVNKLATSFDVTINEFNDAHVIERLERESWARGYNDDESYDDDGKRSYYCDAPAFLEDLADAAIGAPLTGASRSTRSDTDATTTTTTKFSKRSRT